MTNTQANVPQVIIYSTPTCAFCKTEKQYLEHLGVAYTNKDVEGDSAAMDELMAKMGGQMTGVPVTDIAGGIVVGFNRPRIDELLRQNGLVQA